jgi:CII-binding regulator of phage lambda lysogenization HflD
MASRQRIVAEDDPEARAERILQAMLTNARAAGRSMARYAIQLKRLQKDFIHDSDIVELLMTPNSIWMRQVWQKDRVHSELVSVARNYMVKVLREKGWRI